MQAGDDAVLIAHRTRITAILRLFQGYSRGYCRLIVGVILGVI